MDTAQELATSLAIAWLTPVVSFVIAIFNGFKWERTSRTAALCSTAAIAIGFLASAHAMKTWLVATDKAVFNQQHHSEHGDAGEGHGETTEHKDAHKDHGHGEADHKQAAVTAKPVVFTGTFYDLATFGKLKLSISYYIDSLTLTMFCMVTFIATCIHIFAMGYMSEELVEEYDDHQAHVKRPGRFYRFFAFLSLFCFSMLGLVIAGNIFQVFVFWELVGVCSYLLIGFYTERRSANVAANKAFIVNRVGDFGFIIGLMILWTYLGTFAFSNAGDSTLAPGLFELIANQSSAHPDPSLPTVNTTLLIVAGLGVFAGCIGKSAQFPLHTWLPDAMEGPTPVSALVHSATMVAAGVYLSARFYPVFTVEVLQVIAYVGCVTLFLAATIAVVATDIKKVLAYSTISQLGYMMLAIGVGGWGAGLFHLITHAFFKSLLFLGSGAVIYGCHHEQEMPKMGGLRKKMPYTAFAMAVGCCAIAGFGIPGTNLAFSGFFSKDEILATALAYSKINPSHSLLFLTPLITAGITSFYMWRLWFYTFTGKTRDHHVEEHCHEVPKIMYLPLLVLSVLAFGCAWGGEHGVLFSLISFSQPHSPAMSATGLPVHEQILDSHGTAGILALTSALLGFCVAFLLYCRPIVSPAVIRDQLRSVYSFLVAKWHFDELYDAIFVRPSRRVGRFITALDQRVLDGVIDGAAKTTLRLASSNRRFDELVVDGAVRASGDIVSAVARLFRVVQTGQTRQYVLFVAVGVVLVVSAFFGIILPN